MLKKLIICSFLLFSSSYAYKVGDKIDEEVVTKLELKDGKIYVIDIFASWCASCKIELPLVSTLSKKLDPSKYVLKGIDIDENKEEGLSFVKSLNLEFPIIYDNENKIVSKFSPIGVPAIYYIKDKKVLGTVFGAVHDIDKKILEDLKKYGE